jgi:hypothetical protein
VEYWEIIDHCLRKCTPIKQRSNTGSLPRSCLPIGSPRRDHALWIERRLNGLAAKHYVPKIDMREFAPKAGAGLETNRPISHRRIAITRNAMSDFESDDHLALEGSLQRFCCAAAALDFAQCESRLFDILPAKSDPGWATEYVPGFHAV